MKYWRFAFTNDGATDATITNVRVEGDLRMMPGDNICAGVKLGANRDTPHAILGQSLCEIGLGHHAGRVVFTLKAPDDTITQQAVTIDPDVLRGWLTQAEDVTPPEVRYAGYTTVWGVNTASGPVRLAQGIQYDSVVVSDPLGVDRVEFHIINRATGEEAGAPQQFPRVVDLGCEIGWPPPPDLPSACKTTVPLTFEWNAGTAAQSIPRYFEDGYYRMYFKAWDSRGNARQLDVTPEFVVDNTPPVVKVSGSLWDSRKTNQLAGGYVRVDADDPWPGTGVVSVSFSDWIGSNWLVRAQTPVRTCLPCSPTQMSLEYTLDPVALGWASGSAHALRADAKDAATNTASPESWNVSYWATSWQYGGESDGPGGQNDRVINTTADIAAVRTALGANGYLDPNNAAWNGVTPEERQLIYQRSWGFQRNSQRVLTQVGINQARSALAYMGYGNAAVLDGISPADRPLIFPTSWDLGGDNRRMDAGTPEITAYFALLATLNSAGQAKLWHELSPADQDTVGDFTEVTPTAYTYHAFSYEGDPSEVYARISDEYVRPLDHSARRVGLTEGGYFTQTRVPCAANTLGCRESRSWNPDFNVHATTLGTGPMDGRVVVSEALAVLEDIDAASIASGPIGSAIDAWQSLPPGHGANYKLYESTETASIDTAEVTVRNRTWVDAATGLPLKVSVSEGARTVQRQFFSYSSTRQTNAQIPADFFRPPPPTGAEVRSEELLPPRSASSVNPPEPSREEKIAQAIGDRAALGFDADPTVVEALVDTPPANHSVDLAGVPLTHAEMAEYRETLAVQDARSIVDEFGAERETYAGSYLDHTAGGLLYVGFTDDAAGELEDLAELFPYPDRLRAFTADRSFSELRKLQAELRQDSDVDIISFDVTSTAIHQQTNQVVVRTIAPTTAHANEINTRYGAAARLEEGSSQPAASNFSVKAGMQLNFPPGGEAESSCTMGYGAYMKSAVSPTVRKYFQMIPGHCLKDHLQADWGSARAASHGARVTSEDVGGRVGTVSLNMTPPAGTPKGNGGQGADIATVYLLPQKRRTARIQVYHGARKQSYTVKQSSSLREGDKVCQYGRASHDQACGVVTATQEDFLLKYPPYHPVRRYGGYTPPAGLENAKAWVNPTARVSFAKGCPAAKGDSGGPVYRQHPTGGVIAVGMISGIEWTGTECGDGFFSDSSTANNSVVTPLFVPLSSTLLLTTETSLATAG